MKVSWYSVFSFLFFYLEATVKRTLGWEQFWSWLWYLFQRCHSESTWYQLFAEMGEGAIEIISSTKMQTCSLKKIEPRHFTYYCTLLFLSNKPSFQIQPSVDQIIFSAICLPFYFLILCVSWSWSSVSKLFL